MQLEAHLVIFAVAGEEGNFPSSLIGWWKDDGEYLSRE
jgi:hypothetical protein